MELTIERVKKEFSSYQDENGESLKVTDEQATGIIESFSRGLEQSFCDFIRDIIYDGELNELE